MMTNYETVIEVKDAYKKYPTSNYVLKALNMAVPQGCIYSLLGPSGCGKTTLLSCIVGLQKLSAGFINMSTVKSPADIGYMPQEIALQTVCTIEETFYMYGLLFGMEEENILKRLKYLKTLLHLPDEAALISSLSGGQMRRVSFAVALLHNPNTLLLDEPTVGLDPLLRLTIWEFLRDIANKQNKTIIITTHYTEEAKLSDKVGFMRSGEILKEVEPRTIMEAYSTTNLEDVFIHLCKEHNNSSGDWDKPSRKHIKEDKSNFTLQTGIFSYSRFKSNVYKDYLWTKRNLLLLIGLMILPATQSLLFCLTYGRYPNNLKLGLFTEELTSTNAICSSQEYVRYYNGDYGQVNCSLPVSLSCQFYKNLRRKFDVIVYDSEETALADSYRNEIWGWAHINPNFTEAFITRLIYGWGAVEEDIMESMIDVRLDMTNYVIAHYIKFSLRDSLIATLKFLTRSCVTEEAAVHTPVRVEEEIFGGSEMSSGGETVGFLSGFCYYFAVMFTASALFVEKTNGVTNRNKVAGVTFLETVTGHLVIQILMLTIQKAVMLSLLYGAFHYRLNGSLSLVLLGLYLLESVGIALGVLFATIFLATIELNFFIIMSTLSIFFLGGIIWPEQGMHWTLQIFKWAVPGQSMVGSLRNVIVKGDSITSSSVYIGYISTFFWIIFISLIILIVTKIKKL